MNEGSTFKSKRSWTRWLMAVAPWVLSVVVIVLLLQRYSWQDILSQWQQGNSSMLAVWAGLATLVSLFLMTSADWILFRSSLSHVGWRQVLSGRGAMSLIAAISYGAGQGSYGLWLSRIGKCPAGKAVGLMAYIMLSDLTALALLASMALLLSGVPIAADLRWLVVGVAPLGAAALLLAGLLGPKLLPLLFKGKKPFAIVSPWASVSSGAYLMSLLCRGTNLLGLVVITWAAATSFGIEAPLSAFLSYLPIVYLVASLPINVGPFGAVQFAWLHFFGGYGSGEQIIAFQLLFSMFLTLGWVLRGLPFIKKVLKELRQDQPR